MKKKLSERSIAALPAATHKRYEVFDSTVPNLYLRVSKTRAKVWYIRTRIDGRVRRIKLGPYPALSLCAAREKASAIVRDMHTTPAIEYPKFGDAVEQFLDLHSKRRNKTWKQTEQLLNLFACYNDTAIDQITRKDVVKVLDGIVEGGAPVRANRALASIKKFFAWCTDRSAVELNPVSGLKPPTREIARDRVLTDDELAAVWHLAEKRGYPFGPCLKLLILTGQRRSEVSGMTWSEIDMEKAIWTIPASRSKNRIGHTVPLSSCSVKIIRDIHKHKTSEFVFSTTGSTAISGFSRLKCRLDETVGINWRLHDLRRTMATRLAQLSIPPVVVELILNHKSGSLAGVSGIYNRHSYMPEMIEAIELWSSRVKLLVRIDHVNPTRPNGHMNEINSSAA